MRPQSTLCFEAHPAIDLNLKQELPLSSTVRIRKYVLRKHTLSVNNSSQCTATTLWLLLGECDGAGNRRPCMSLSTSGLLCLIRAQEVLAEHDSAHRTKVGRVARFVEWRGCYDLREEDRTRSWRSACMAAVCIRVPSRHSAFARILVDVVSVLDQVTEGALQRRISGTSRFPRLNFTSKVLYDQAPL